MPNNQKIEEEDRGRRREGGLLIASSSSSSSFFASSELPIWHDGRKWRNDVLPVTKVAVSLPLPPSLPPPSVIVIIIKGRRTKVYGRGS